MKRTQSTPGAASRTETAAALLPDGRFMTLELTWNGEAIAQARLGLAAARPKGGSSAVARRVELALADLVAGREADFSGLPLHWEALPPFTRAVLETLYARVPSGTTVTYGRLAELAGHRGKARAVGGAMARNPWPLIVPCHRVLGSDGSLTGYTNPHGLDLKALLLGLECQDPADGEG